MAEAYSKHNVKPNKHRDPKWDGSYRPCDDCGLCEMLGEDMSETKCGHKHLKKRIKQSGNKDRD